MRKLDEILEEVGQLREDALKKIINCAVSKLVSEKHDEQYEPKRKSGPWKPLRHHDRVRAIGAETLKGRFLIHMFKQEGNSAKNTKNFTRYTIAEKLNTSPSQISRVVLPLINSELIIRVRKYFPESKKFRDVYSLTLNGAQAAQELTKKGIVQFD